MKTEIHLPLRLREFNLSEPATVSVCTITFNHVAFISDAIESFLDQIAPFRIEIIIYDDASTDGTADIIKDYARKYPTIIFPILSDANIYSLGINPYYNIVFPAATGKYIAWCEGDDYWIDPYKLMVQVEYLELNSKIGMVFTDVNFLYEDTKVIKKGRLSKENWNNGFNMLSHLIGKRFLAPPTWLIRTELVRQSKLIAGIDSSFVLSLDVLRMSCAYFLNSATAVYRVLPESASRSNDLAKVYRYRKGVFNLQLEYCRTYVSDFCVEKKIKDIGYSSLIPLASKVGDLDFLVEARAYQRSMLFYIRIYYNFIYSNKYVMFFLNKFYRIFLY